MEYTEIAYDVDGPVATITLDRPDRLNAFTVTMQRELNDAFDHVDADDAVRAVIVTGRGRGFCAGADLGSGGDTFDAEAQGTNSDRVTVEWVNTPEGAAKTFRREWLQGDVMTRRKNLPIEYNL